MLRKQRFDRLKELKFISDEMDYPVYQKEFDGKRPSWETLTPKQQEQWITDMATYAAMIEIVDSGIGELVETIKEKGMLDNTVFIFLSDNGATKEVGYLVQLMADLSNTPYRSYKSQCFQGGTSTPFILWRCRKKQDERSDLQATCPHYRHTAYLHGYCHSYLSVRIQREFARQELTPSNPWKKDKAQRIIL